MPTEGETPASREEIMDFKIAVHYPRFEAATQKIFAEHDKHLVHG